MIRRVIKEKILSLSSKYPILILTGPRQSGKTTLIKSVFNNLPYVSLEDPDVRDIAINDPRGFLSNFPNSGIFDE
ncbi:MAG: AAA family ATPase, partial [Bacteroidota bacterium]